MASLFPLDTFSQALFTSARVLFPFFFFTYLSSSFNFSFRTFAFLRARFVLLQCGGRRCVSGTFSVRAFLIDSILRISGSRSHAVESRAEGARRAPESLEREERRKEFSPSL